MDAGNRRCFWGASRDHGVVEENVVKPLGTLNNVDARRLCPQKEQQRAVTNASGVLKTFPLEERNSSILKTILLALRSKLQGSLCLVVLVLELRACPGVSEWRSHLSSRHLIKYQKK